MKVWTRAFQCCRYGCKNNAVIVGICNVALCSNEGQSFCLVPFYLFMVMIVHTVNVGFTITAVILFVVVGKLI